VRVPIRHAADDEAVVRPRPELPEVAARNAAVAVDWIALRPLVP
jgi:hypothetical protein